MKYLTPLRKNKWFTIFVVVPVLLSAFYYGLIASDQYVSEARFVVKSQGRQTPQVSTLANLIQTTGMSSGQEQTNAVMSYIKSRAALQDLGRHLDLRVKYRANGADLLSRYPMPWRSDRFENLYLYYSDMVEAHTDTESGLAILTVKAFTPEDAQAINNQLLGLSEDLVNRLNTKAREKAITEAERRVAEAETRVRTARLALAAYRNSEALIDPSKQASGVLEVVNRLVAEQAALQAQLDLMVKVTPLNPSIPAIRNRIAALGAEIGAQTGRAVGTRTAISSKLATYEKLSLEQEFAAQTLAAANAALEQARVEAQRQQFYLERVVEPDKPDLAMLPHRLTKVLTIAGAALCLYLIGWMLVVGILEHSPED